MDLRIHERRVGGVAFSPDGRFLASSGMAKRPGREYPGGIIRLHAVETGATGSSCSVWS